MAKISTRKRGETWYFSFEAALTVEGKRKRVEKGGYRTEKEARDEGTKALAKYISGDIAIASERISVAEYLRTWMEMKETLVRPTTAENYWTCIKHFLPILGPKDIQKLRPRDIDAAMLQLAKQGYAHGTLKISLNVLKGALAYAVYPGELLSVNPAAYIHVPRNAPRHVIERKIIRRDKLEEILAALPFGHPAHIPVVIAYHTGMRIGEVCGLTWDCVDLANGTISVVRQVTYTAKHGHAFGPPKTASSVRAFPVGRELLAALRRWKAKQAENELSRGKTYFLVYEGQNGALWQIQKQEAATPGLKRRPLVCTRENGMAVLQNTVCVSLEKCGINAHSLRHTHATICAEHGAPPKGLAGRLGHSSATLTENLYTHETQRMQLDTIAAFEQDFQKA